MIHIAIPRTTTNMQMTPRRPIIHDTRPSVPNIRREPMSLRIKWPNDHVLGSFRKRRTSMIERITGTFLRGATEHVARSRRQACSLHYVRVEIQRFEQSCVGSLVLYFLLAGYLYSTTFDRQRSKCLPSRESLRCSIPSCSHYHVFISIAKEGPNCPS